MTQYTHIGIGGEMRSRLAVISDIHGNLPALRAVFDDLQQQDVENVVVAGDMVGRGPQSTEVVQFIFQKGWPCVRGNHEDYMVDFCKGDIPVSWHHEEEWAAARWMAAQMDEALLPFLANLPFSWESYLYPTIYVCHGSPFSNSQGIGIWTSEEEQLELLDQIPQSILVCAHTHRAVEFSLGTQAIVNVGSVGLPFNADSRAQYVIFELSEQDVQWRFRQVEYDVQEILQVYHESGFLREGGVTAALLYKELQHARPFLMPFLKWASLLGRPPHQAELEHFLDVYDPSLSMKEFLEEQIQHVF